MATLSIRLDPDDMSQDGVTVDAVGSIPALVQRGITALRDILPISDDAAMLKELLTRPGHPVVLLPEPRPVITPKTTEVEDCHGDHWFRVGTQAFEMAQVRTDAPIVATPEDLEHLFGPLTEITRAGSEGTMYPQRTAQDEGFEPDEAEQPSKMVLKSQSTIVDNPLMNEYLRGIVNDA